MSSRPMRWGFGAALLLSGCLWAASAGAVAEAEPAAGPEAGTEEAAAPAEAGSVVRALFTSGVVDREPTDRLDELGSDASQIFYFTELHELAGHTVVHRWEHGGEVKAEVPFTIGGPRWRVFSSKKLDPSWLGEWTVTVLDEDGRTLHEDRFVYRAVEVEAPAAPAAPAP